MKKTVLPVIAGILIGIFVLTGTAQAEPVGILTLERGKVKLRRQTVDTLYTKPGELIPLKNGDELQTGVDTRAKIVMNNNQDDVDLFSKTYFIVEAVDSQQRAFQLPVGKAHFRVGQPAAGVAARPFRLRAANALVGVKGTEFVVGVADGNSSLLAVSGLVSMANAAIPNVEIEVQPSQASRIQPDKPPTAPVTVTPQVMENIIAGDSAEEFDAVEFGDVVDVPAEEEEEEAEEEEEEEEESEEESEEEEDTEEDAEDQSDEEAEESDEDVAGDEESDVEEETVDTEASDADTEVADTEETDIETEIADTEDPDIGFDEVEMIEPIDDIADVVDIGSIISDVTEVTDRVKEDAAEVVEEIKETQKRIRFIFVEQ
jgi:hypothetical protein